MKFIAFHSAVLSSLASGAISSPAIVPRTGGELVRRSFPVSVHLPNGDTVLGGSQNFVDSFNAIPYAQPPVGSLRLRPPQRINGLLGTVDGRGITPACPQMFTSPKDFGILSQVASSVSQLPFVRPILGGQEDCLTVNVQRPAGTTAGDSLPVLFWMYGGGFEFGATNAYDGTSLLFEAMAQGQPFIFVAVNYRLAGFGFMPGKEVKAAGCANLGLLDQRMALEWVADNIASFGGDPSKVTIWGESAGSMSVLDQMLLFNGNATYKGKTLFRGAIMDSGTVSRAEAVDSPRGQAVYDAVVTSAGCTGTKDTLECLRQVDYETLLGAITSLPGILGYNLLASSYMPRADGIVFKESPDVLLRSGKMHVVSCIVGDQEDEGTLFSIFQSNLTTTGAFVDYLSQVLFRQASKATLEQLVRPVPYCCGRQPVPHRHSERAVPRL